MSVLATILGWFAVAASAYFVLLFVLSSVRARLDANVAVAAPEDAPLFVIVVPARDEELVIGQTVVRAQELAGEPFVLVMDDGSSDRTADVVRAVGDPDRTLVITRDPQVAGRGKGDVLNAAVELVTELVAADDARLRGRQPSDIVICILDADGWLDPDALLRVASRFRDPRVAGVQVSVRMWNARSGFLARMQDIEFAAYGNLFQAGRDVLGSVLMGGNGQFVRLTALQDLGPRPWTDCLTEDLDIGLRLVQRGWRLRACPSTWVAQQAVGEPRRFVRQRTRWVQGHLSCWHHLLRLWHPRARVRIVARIDLSLHLLLGMYGALAAAQFVLVAGLATGTASWGTVMPVPAVVAATLVLVLMLIPAGLVAITYQRHAQARFPAAAVVGVLAVYCLYHYLWSIPATAIALARLALRRRSWAKTSRSTITDHDLAAAAAAAQGSA